MEIIFSKILNLVEYYLLMFFNDIIQKTQASTTKWQKTVLNGMI